MRLRAMAPASAMSWHLATLCPRSVLWQTLRESRRWLRSLYRLTPLWTLMRRPSRSRRSKARSRNKGGRASRYLCRCARRSTLRHVHVTRRATPGVAPARSSTTSWMGGTIPHSSLGLARTSTLWQCFCTVLWQNLLNYRAHIHLSLSNDL